MKVEWLQIFTIVISTAGLFLWARRESSADRRDMDKKLDDIRNNTDRKLEANKDLIRKIHRESTDLLRDFHYKLIEIEKNRS